MLKRQQYFLNQFILLIFIIIGVLACNTEQKGEKETIVRSDVKVTFPIVMDATTNKFFQGSTLFTQHLQIRAQSTGIIVNSNISVGKYIRNGEALFIIKSREAMLMKASNSKNDVLFKMADTIFSFSTGIVDQILVQAGDFVQQGDPLATFVNEHSMRIQVSIPLEEDISLFQNKTCIVILPNNHTLKGIVSEILPAANNANQTYQLLVKPESVVGLTENIHVKVSLKRKTIQNGVFVPKSAVYANEELTMYWVLKIVNDSMAVKVQVVPGIETDSLIQLTDHTLTLNDRIIYKGGYSLTDSALVNITQTFKNE